MTTSSIRSVVVAALGLAVAFGIGVPILRTTVHPAAQLLGVFVTGFGGLIAALGLASLLIITIPRLARSASDPDGLPLVPATSKRKAT